MALVHRNSDSLPGPPSPSLTNPDMILPYDPRLRDSSSTTHSGHSGPDITSLNDQMAMSLSTTRAINRADWAQGGSGSGNGNGHGSGNGNGNSNSNSNGNAGNDGSGSARPSMPGEWNEHDETKDSAAAASPSSTVRARDAPSPRARPGAAGEPNVFKSGTSFLNLSRFSTVSTGAKSDGSNGGAAPPLEEEDPEEVAARNDFVRAEEILANAKKRLTAMEGNLTRARSISVSRSASVSSHVRDESGGGSGSGGARGAAGAPRANGWAISAAKLRGTHWTPAGAAANHSRVFSEHTLPNPSLHLVDKVQEEEEEEEGGERASAPRAPPRIRSSSAMGSIHGEDRSPHGDGYGYGSGSFPWQRGIGRLEPLQEDELLSPASDSSRGGGAGSRGLDRLGELSAKARSNVQLRDLREQMQDLKGKLDVLKRRTREDSMHRRSMQYLKSPSPFTDADAWRGTPPRSGGSRQSTRRSNDGGDDAGATPTPTPTTRPLITTTTTTTDPVADQEPLTSPGSMTGGPRGVIDGALSSLDEKLHTNHAVHSPASPQRPVSHRPNLSGTLPIPTNFVEKSAFDPWSPQSEKAEILNVDDEDAKDAAAATATDDEAASAAEGGSKGGSETGAAAKAGLVSGSGTRVAGDEEATRETTNEDEVDSAAHADAGAHADDHDHDHAAAHPSFPSTTNANDTTTDTNDNATTEDRDHSSSHDETNLDSAAAADADSHPDGTAAEPVLSHEDRPDAFDYENFILSSTMGTYSSHQRHGSRSSRSSSTTSTIGPDAYLDADLSSSSPMDSPVLAHHSPHQHLLHQHMRNASAGSTSSLDTFATAHSRAASRLTQGSRHGLHEAASRDALRNMPGAFVYSAAPTPVLDEADEGEGGDDNDNDDEDGYAEDEDGSSSDDHHHGGRRKRRETLRANDTSATASSLGAAIAAATGTTATAAAAASRPRSAGHVVHQMIGSPDGPLSPRSPTSPTSPTSPYRRTGSSLGRMQRGSTGRDGRIDDDDDDDEVGNRRNTSTSNSNSNSNSARDSASTPRALGPRDHRFSSGTVSERPLSMASSAASFSRPRPLSTLWAGSSSSAAGNPTYSIASTTASIFSTSMAAPAIDPATDPAACAARSQIMRLLLAHPLQTGDAPIRDDDERLVAHVVMGLQRQCGALVWAGAVHGLGRDRDRDRDRNSGGVGFGVGSSAEQRSSFGFSGASSARGSGGSAGTATTAAAAAAGDRSSFGGRGGLAEVRRRLASARRELEVAQSWPEDVDAADVDAEVDAEVDAHSDVQGHLHAHSVGALDAHGTHLFNEVDAESSIDGDGGERFVAL